VEENKNKLIPENDVQEAWERIGRMYAAMAYIENDRFPNTDVIYTMLGGDLNVLFAKRNGSI